jgi:hypothetical protein
MKGGRGQNIPTLKRVEFKKIAPRTAQNMSLIVTKSGMVTTFLRQKQG